MLNYGSTFFASKDHTVLKKVQPKLRVNEPGDIYEREADAMADRVMGLSNTRPHEAGPFTGLIGRSLQRKCAHCEEEDNKKLMRKENGVAVGTAVSSYFSASLQASKSGGTPLPETTKSQMENAFQSDFSEVRIHSGNQAASMNDSINARAFTLGNDIYFNAGQFNPHSFEGKHLLAHELTHVMQQGNEVRRQVAAEPQIKGCTPGITGQDDASQIVNQTIETARNMVNTAIGLLENAPAAGSVYETALGTHFGAVSDRARLNIRRRFNRFLRHFTPTNFICNSGRICDRRTQAFWLASDGLLHVCPSFWLMRANPTCQAIIFIHEIAHDAGLDDAFWAANNFHPANRGDRSYPVMGEPTRRVSRSARAQMPDAYAFFAAHVHNGADTPGNCFSP